MARAGGNPAGLANAIRAHLIDKSKAFRIAAGTGDGASETERTALCQTNQLRLLSTEYGRITDSLAEIIGYKVGHDADGSPLPDAQRIYQVTGDKRTAMEARLAELNHQMSLRAGVEGEKELQAARRVDALRIRSMKETIADQHEVTRRAHEIAREERLYSAARTRAKFLGGNNNATLPDYR